MQWSMHFIRFQGLKKIKVSANKSRNQDFKSFEVEVKELNLNNITFINEDILKYEFIDIAKDGIRIIGNLPYNISTEILFKIASTPLSIVDAHFMLQKEVIDRKIAKPGSKEYGRC